MYDLIYTQGVQKQISKLPEKNQKHIISVLERARIRPQAHFERLVGDKSYKLRAGDYRIIADIDTQSIAILVIKVGHRKNIYK